MKPKTYTKIHRLEKAAKNHAHNIRTRGGKVKQEKIGSKYKLIYSF